MRAPFPWFGGKSRVAHLVWDRFGDVRNYVEPFAGSLAVLLARPTAAKIETVNDLDCWIANFWRALYHDPEAVAHHADWPVNEADLHARHLWLVGQAEFRERMKTDPDFFDPKVAGWWVWGISQWIGSGWCTMPQQQGRTNAGRAGRGILAEGVVNAPGLITPGRGAAGKGIPRGVQTVTQKRPHVTNHGGGMGVHRNLNARIRPALNETSGLHDKRPRLDRGGRGVTRQIPDLSGDSGASGRGVHAGGKLPQIGGRDWGVRSEAGMERNEGGIYEWFYALADRLRRVRVCCGDWTRVLGPAPTTCIGTTAVFLDPPYAVEDRSEVYAHDSRDVANDVREWAIANGDNPELRIALCGYEGEHRMPDDWECIAWKSSGGYGNQANGATQGRENSRRERIWFSPHCLKPQGNLFFGQEVVAQDSPLSRTEAAHAVLAAGCDPEGENGQPRRSDTWGVAQMWRDSLVEEAYAGEEA